MKMITKVVSALGFLVLVFPLLVNAEQAVFKNGKTWLMIVSTKGVNEKLLVALGGNKENSTAASADCLAIARLAPSRETSQKLRGELLPMYTDLYRYSPSETTVTVTVNFTQKGASVLSMDVSDYCGINSDFTGNYFSISSSGHEFYEVISESIKYVHQNALNLVRHGQIIAAKDQLKGFFSDDEWVKVAGSELGTNMVSAANDYAFFEQELGNFDASVRILKHVVDLAPTREVAFLNLADAYWADGKIKDALENYKKYEDLMSFRRKEGNIPSRVKSRLSG